MEAFYASVSGVIAAFGGSMFFYILLRKDIQQVATDLQRGLQKAEDDRHRIKTELKGEIKEGLRKAEGDRLRIKTELEGDILRLEGRVMVVDDRVREVEGDMKVVKHQLRINEMPPADPEPTQSRSARNEPSQHGYPVAPVPSKKQPAAPR